MTTIKQVAEKAGVSIATVSYVVNRSRFVSDPLKQRVYAAMRELDYLPNHMARSLRGGKTGIIGVIAPNYGSLYFAEFAATIEKESSLLGYSVIYCNSERNIQHEKYYIDNLISKQVDGIIFINAGQSDKELMRLLHQQIPIVLIDWIFPGANIDHIASDHKLAGLIAGDYLYQLGHKEFACVLPGENPSLQLQLFGFEQALQQYGHTLKPQQKIMTGYEIHHGKETFRQLMSLTQPPTAIFFVTDALAIGGIIAAQEDGIRIPQDLSIMGFDNLPISQDIYPGLTTLDKNLKAMSHEAITLLDQRVTEAPDSTPTGHQSIVIKPELVIRQSCSRNN